MWHRKETGSTRKNKRYKNAVESRRQNYLRKKAKKQGTVTTPVCKTDPL